MAEPGAYGSGAIAGALLMLASWSFFRWMFARESVAAWQLAAFGLLIVSELFQRQPFGAPWALTDISLWRARAPGVLDGLGAVLLIAYLVRAGPLFDMPRRNRVWLWLLAACQAVLSLVVASSRQLVFVQASSFAVPAIVALLMTTVLWHNRQRNTSCRMASNLVFLTVLAESARTLVVNVLAPERTLAPAFFVIGWPAAMVALIGAVCWAQQHGAAWRAREGRPMLGVPHPHYTDAGALHDTTHSLTVALDAANAQIANQRLLMACVGHDLRAPLATIAGYARLLRGIGTAQQHQQVAAIERNIVYESSLVEELLDHTRAQAGLLTLSPTVCNLPLLLDDMVQHAVVLASAQGNRVAFERGEAIPEWVSLDGHRLCQVLINLLSNAADCTRQGQITLRVAGQKAGTQWRLQFAVVDTGRGIAAGDQSRAFESFEQVLPSRSGEPGMRPGVGLGPGLGLGLFIARRIVEAMAGQLTLASEPGKGSCFSFSVDVAQVSAPTAPPSSVHRLKPNMDRARRADAVTTDPDASLERPSRELLQQLAQFARHGQWSDIDQWIIDTQTAQPQYQAFSAQIRLLLDEFDFIRIQQWANAKKSQTK